MLYANTHLMYLIFTLSLVKRGKYICSKNLQLAFDIIRKGYYLQVQLAYPCYGQFSWIRLLVCKYSWIRRSLRCCSIWSALEVQFSNWFWSVKKLV